MKIELRKRIGRLVHRVIRFCKWTLFVSILVRGVKYGFEAKARYRAASDPSGWATEFSDYPNSEYTAVSKFVSYDTSLLRLYPTGDPALIAERTYTEHGVNLHWSAQELIYDTSDDSYLGGDIQLPPTRLDRFLARLP
ncbi:MAG: hypothetical protein Q7T87_00760 [Polaromonas sp.]|nr:hypothetical protein [Polaromonas sp.]